MALQTFVDTHVKFDAGAGLFVLPNILVRPAQQQAIRLRTAATPNRDGIYTAGGVRGEHRVQVVGRIVLSAGQSMDDAWRELVTGLPIGVIGKLYNRQDDTTFRWAEVEALDPGESQEGSALDYSVSFLCADPFEYSTGLSQVARNGVGNMVANNAGGLEANPTVQVVVSAIVGANPWIRVTNLLTGKAVKLYPSAPLTYVLDHRLRTVTRSTGGDGRTDLDATSELFALALGNNTIEIAASNCTPGDTTISWRSCWP